MIIFIIADTAAVLGLGVIELYHGNSQKVSNNTTDSGYQIVIYSNFAPVSSLKSLEYLGPRGYKIFPMTVRAVSYSAKIDFNHFPNKKSLLRIRAN